MSQPLASDLNNPEFVGAINPDSLLHVEFYLFEPLDKWASDEASYQQGRPVRIMMPGGKRPYVRIMKPGDNTSIIETPVREDHKRRFPQQWLYFQMQEGLIDGGANIPGWKLEDWPELQHKEEQLHDLKARRFYTVEQIAGASDAQVQGMGFGGPGLRESARAALRSKVSSDINDKLAEKDAAIAKMQQQMAELAEKMNTMTAQPQPILHLPKKRGRKPKVIMEQTAANG